METSKSIAALPWILKDSQRKIYFSSVLLAYATPFFQGLSTSQPA